MCSCFFVGWWRNKKDETLKCTAYYGVKNTIKTEPFTDEATQNPTENNTMSVSDVKQDSTQNNIQQTTIEQNTSANTLPVEEKAETVQGDVITTGSAVPVFLLIVVFISAIAVAVSRRKVNNEKTK